jgi:hypothetical protein
MTDKMTTHPLKQMVMGIFSTKVVFAALLTTSVLAQPANAVEQEWWFDVEVILFERNLEEVNLSEQFKQSRLEQPASNVLDLVTPYLQPDLSYLRAGLPYCRASNRLKVKTQYEQDFAFPLPVVTTVVSSSSQTDKQQEPQTNQVLSVNSEKVTEENFRYQVATTDIFAKSDDTVSSVQTTDAEDVNPVNIDLAPKSTLARPSIQVEFIEWQVPSEFLCAYAEQVDPSFASMVSLQNDGSGAAPSNQIQRVPEIINGTEWQQRREAFLLPTSTMYMNELYEKIKRQRDITPILHVNWRQEVKFGREDAQTFRLFAGENFADQFDANGLAVVKDTDSLFASLNQSTDDFYIPEQELVGLTPEQQQALLVSINDTAQEAVTEDLFARIAAALADDTPINIDQAEGLTEQQPIKIDPKILKELWRLDGEMTVYLRNVGRIPYLHIDSNIDIRQPIFDPKKAQKTEGLSTHLSGQGAIVVNPLQQPGSLQTDSQQPNFLQSVNFNQLRRVISKQVHYFDHPLFGMIVRINRFRWPEEPSKAIDSVSQNK